MCKSVFKDKKDMTKQPRGNPATQAQEDEKSFQAMKSVITVSVGLVLVVSIFVIFQMSLFLQKQTPVDPPTFGFFFLLSLIGANFLFSQRVSPKGSTGTPPLHLLVISLVKVSFPLVVMFLLPLFVLQIVIPWNNLLHTQQHLLGLPLTEKFIASRAVEVALPWVESLLSLEEQEHISRFAILLWWLIVALSSEILFPAEKGHMASKKVSAIAQASLWGVILPVLILWMAGETFFIVSQGTVLIWFLWAISLLIHKYFIKRKDYIPKAYQRARILTRLILGCGRYDCLTRRGTYCLGIMVAASLLRDNIATACDCLQYFHLHSLCGLFQFLFCDLWALTCPIIAATFLAILFLVVGSCLAWSAFQGQAKELLPTSIRQLTPYGILLALSWGCFGISLLPSIPTEKFYLQHQSSVFGEKHGGEEASTGYLALIAHIPERMLQKETLGKEALKHVSPQNTKPLIKTETSEKETLKYVSQRSSKSLVEKGISEKEILRYVQVPLTPLHMASHNMAVLVSAILLILGVTMFIGLIGMFFRSWFVRLLLLLNGMMAKLILSKRERMKRLLTLFGGLIPFRIYVFSDLNEQSVMLAESVRRGISGARSVLIFPGVRHMALADDTERMLQNRVNALGQVLFERSNLTSFELGYQEVPVTVFLCKPNVAENFSDAATLLSGPGRRLYADCNSVSFHLLAEGSGHVHALETILKRNANGDFLPKEEQPEKPPRVTCFAHNLTRAAVYRLLDQAPLYLGLSNDEPPNILIIGSNRLCAEAVRAVSWMGQWKGMRPHLHVIAKDATYFLRTLQSMFRELELNFATPWREIPIDHDPCTLDASAQKWEKVKKWEEVKWEANYILIALEDDSSTLRMTSNLYYEMCRNRRSTRTCVIAPYVRDPALNENALNFIPFWGTEHEDLHAHPLHIHPFGSLRESYHVNNIFPMLLGDPPIFPDAQLETLWWHVHKAWASKRSEEEHRKDESSASHITLTEKKDDPLSYVLKRKKKMWNTEENYLNENDALVGKQNERVGVLRHKKMRENQLLHSFAHRRQSEARTLYVKYLIVQQGLLSQYSSHLNARVLRLWKEQLSKLKDPDRRELAHWEFSRWCAFQRSNGYTCPQDPKEWSQLGFHHIHTKEDLRLPERDEKMDACAVFSFFQQEIFSCLENISDTLNTLLSQEEENCNETNS